MCDGVHSCLRIHVNALPTVYLVYTILPSPSGSGDLEDVDRVTSSMGQTWYDFGAFIGIKVSHLEDLKCMPSGQMSRIMW